MDMRDTNGSELSIYTYLDYRKYLRDRYAQIRQRESSFTLRRIADLVGLKSAGHVTNILNGNRGIPLRAVVRFARAFGLLKRETAYLELLVHYDAAKTHVERKYYFEKIALAQRKNHVVVERDKYEFYDKWYYSAVRELVEVYEIRDDYNELARLLVPSITPAEARKALELLASLKLIYKDTDGRWRRRDTVIVTPQEWSSLAIRSFQIETAGLGRHALEKVPRDHRDISTITMSISQRTFKRLKELLEQWRQEVFALAASDEAPDQVFELNLQLFPLSKRKEDPRNDEETND